MRLPAASFLLLLNKSHRQSQSLLSFAFRNKNQQGRIINNKNKSSIQTTTTRSMSDDTAKANENAPPSVVGSKDVGSTKWLKLQTLTWKDPTGKERLWDMATRTTKQSVGKADAVIIIPLLKKKDSNEVLDTILVEQFRPPVGQTTIEFPAGLIDKDETPEQAALRELREETGYVGESPCLAPLMVSPQACMSPGLTDESVHIVLVNVDLDNPYNHGTPKPKLDDGEFVTVKRVPLMDGLQSLFDKESSGSNPKMPFTGLYMFAVGLQLGKQYGK